MSYRLEFKGKKYWIKEVGKNIEIHYNIDKKGCSNFYTLHSDAHGAFEKIMVLIDKINK